MKQGVLFLVLILLAIRDHGQECMCPQSITVESEEGKPNRVFHFSNGAELAICGYTSPDGDSSYNKFALVSCGDHRVLKLWSVDETAQAEFKNDVLYIKDMYSLPIGQSFSTLWRPFYIHKFWYKNGELLREEYYRKDLGKYSRQQLDEVFTAYKMLPEGGKVNMMRVARMLFWAAFSGSKEAAADLDNFEHNFGPFEGVTAEEWKGIHVGYIKWKEYMKGN